MNGFDVYRSYVAIKSHFHSSYDYFKYSGKISVTHKSYEKRNDKHFFELVAKKIPERELIAFFVSNFLHNKEMWIGELIENYEESRLIFVNWKRKMSLLYEVYKEDLSNIHKFLINNNLKKKDLFKCKNSDHPLIFRFMNEGMIEKETFILLNNLLCFTKRINITDIIWKTEINKLNNYTPFISYNKDKIKEITINIMC